jgi:hypothetical protein
MKARALCTAAIDIGLRCHSIPIWVLFNLASTSFIILLSVLFSNKRSNTSSSRNAHDLGLGLDFVVDLPEGFFFGGLVGFLVVVADGATGNFLVPGATVGFLPFGETGESLVAVAADDFLVFVAAADFLVADAAGFLVLGGAASGLSATGATEQDCLVAVVGDGFLVGDTFCCLSGGGFFGVTCSGVFK